MLTVREDLIEKKAEEKLFILTSDGRHLFSLNEVGAFIWNAFKHNKAKNDIVKDLVSLYDVEEGQAIKDVDVFIKEVRKHSAELINP